MALGLSELNKMKENDNLKKEIIEQKLSSPFILKSIEPLEVISCVNHISLPIFKDQVYKLNSLDNSDYLLNYIKEKNMKPGNLINLNSITIKDKKLYANKVRELNSEDNQKVLGLSAYISLSSLKSKNNKSIQIFTSLFPSFVINTKNKENLIEEIKKFYEKNKTLGIGGSFGLMFRSNKGEVLQKSFLKDEEIDEFIDRLDEEGVFKSYIDSNIENNININVVNTWFNHPYMSQNNIDLNEDMSKNKFGWGYFILKETDAGIYPNIVDYFDGNKIRKKENMPFDLKNQNELLAPLNYFKNYNNENKMNFINSISSEMSLMEDELKKSRVLNKDYILDDTEDNFVFKLNGQINRNNGPAIINKGTGEKYWYLLNKIVPKHINDILNSDENLSIGVADINGSKFLSITSRKTINNNYPVCIYKEGSWFRGKPINKEEVFSLLNNRFEINIENIRTNEPFDDFKDAYNKYYENNNLRLG